MILANQIPIEVKVLQISILITGGETMFKHPFKMVS